MDFSTSASENESLSEVETLRQQLNTYKMINADMSKKIQELKIELNAFKHENSIIKREVLEEREKSVRYRHLFTTMNNHCLNFINTYVHSMQQINDIDASLIDAIPGIDQSPKSDDDKESPQNQTVVPQVERQRPTHTVRSQLHAALHEDDDTAGNVLNTILEESLPMFTSTPIVTNRPGISNSAPQTSNNPSPATLALPQHLFKSKGSRNSDKVSPIIPENMFKSPQSPLDDSLSLTFGTNEMQTPRNRVSDPGQQVPANDFLSSTSNVSQTVLETPKLQANPSSRRISTAPEDAIEEYPDKENETDGDDTTEQTIHHRTVKEVKNYRVALSPLKSACLQNNKTNTESPEYESCEDESTMADSQSTSNNTNTLKRKSSESGRPRRKARPDPKMLKEPSLRTKLRRSKKKI